MAYQHVKIPLLDLRIQKQEKSGKIKFPRHLKKSS